MCDKLTTNTTLDADQAVIKDAQQIKLQYDNRRIQAGETVTHFLDEITKLRLKLSHLNIRLTDEEIVTKLIHGMLSAQNRTYINSTKFRKRVQNRINISSEN